MSKYHKDVSKYQTIDVYDLIQIYKVTNPALQHALKKILMAGERGHKDFQQDCQDIIDSVGRARSLELKSQGETLPSTSVILYGGVKLTNVTILGSGYDYTYIGYDKTGEPHYFNNQNVKAFA